MQFLTSHILTDSLIASRGTRATVVNFVTVKASKSNKIQLGSAGALQRIQSKAVTNHGFQQVSPSTGIWFGIRWVIFLVYTLSSL